MAPSCYTIESLSFDEPLFKSFEKTVVLTMKNSSRRDSYMRQINEYRPTSKVYIQINDGFKKCDKYDVRNTHDDILHALVSALTFTGASKPVLILEDDVSFMPNIRKAAAYVEEFITTNKNWDIYALACTSFRSRVSLKRHIRTYKMGSCHAWIYSPRAISWLTSHTTYSEILGLMRCKKLTHELAISLLLVNYMHRTPLAVQPHPMTENASLWMTPLFKLFHKLCRSEKDGTLFYKVMTVPNVLGGTEAFLASATMMCTYAVCYVIWKNT